MDMLGINLKGRGKQVVKFKKELTIVMHNIITNCKVIIENDTLVTDAIATDTKSLIKEVESIIEWYDRYDTKSAVMDYLRDYYIMDKRFITILELLPEEFDYELCLVEERFKLSYNERVEKNE